MDSCIRTLAETCARADAFASCTYAIIGTPRILKHITHTYTHIIMLLMFLYHSWAFHEHARFLILAACYALRDRNTYTITYLARNTATSIARHLQCWALTPWHAQQHHTESERRREHVGKNSAPHNRQTQAHKEQQREGGMPWRAPESES